MRKWLLIAFIPVSLLAVIAWWEGKTCQTAAEQCAAANPSNPQYSDSLFQGRVWADSTVQKQNPDVEADESCHRSQSYLCQILTPANLPNVFLVLIGVGGIIVAIGTLNILARQTQAADDSAKAALLNAQAVINSERPWLLIQREGIQKPYLEPAESMAQRMSHCILIIRNYGRTPAKNYIEKSEMRMGDSPVNPPPTGIYDEEPVRDDAPFVFPPGETVPAEAILISEGTIRQADREAIMNSRKFLWLCGRVKYRDTFDTGGTSEHETRFCLRWETRLNSPEPFWVMAGPSEYNRAT